MCLLFRTAVSSWVSNSRGRGGGNKFAPPAQSRELPGTLEPCVARVNFGFARESQKGMGTLPPGVLEDHFPFTRGPLLGWWEGSSNQLAAPKALHLGWAKTSRARSKCPTPAHAPS